MFLLFPKEEPSVNLVYAFRQILVPDWGNHSLLAINNPYLHQPVKTLIKYYQHNNRHEYWYKILFMLK